ncbi:MAG: glycosyltransferase [Acidobacteria bacterium]|nr:glycosyltransferase [Acidobacteriota bacterium]
MTHQRVRPVRTKALGVVMPVHNEEDYLQVALAAVGDACDVVGAKLQLGVVVVLDACDDASGHIVTEWRRVMRQRATGVSVRTVECHANNVGVARAIGCAEILNTWADVDVTRIWLSTTDADSRVPNEWLHAQLLAHEGGIDLWTGRVQVDDWTEHDPRTHRTWSRGYEAEEFPIHGTNMGFNAWRYLQVGGFPPFATGEDREIFRLLVEAGAPWTHDRLLRVSTSARRSGRAPQGFTHVLQVIGEENISEQVV